MMPPGLDDARKVMPLVSAGTKHFKVKNPYGTDSLNAEPVFRTECGSSNFRVW